MSKMPRLEVWRNISSHYPLVNWHIPPNHRKFLENHRAVLPKIGRLWNGRGYVSFREGMYIYIHVIIIIIIIMIPQNCATSFCQVVDCFQASFMGGILDGPWFRKGDNVFLGTIKENKMTWVPGFNHPPCDLVEVGKRNPSTFVVNGDAIGKDSF